MTFKPIDSKRDEFRKYLERSGVVDEFTKVLIKLFNTPERPENAIQFIFENLGHSLLETDQYEYLKRELEDSRNEVLELKRMVETLQTERDYYTEVKEEPNEIKKEPIDNSEQLSSQEELSSTNNQKTDQELPLDISSTSEISVVAVDDIAEKQEEVTDSTTSVTIENNIQDENKVTSTLKDEDIKDATVVEAVVEVVEQKVIEKSDESNESKETPKINVNSENISAEVTSAPSESEPTKNTNQEKTTSDDTTQASNINNVDSTKNSEEKKE